MKILHKVSEQIWKIYRNIQFGHLAFMHLPPPLFFLTSKKCNLMFKLLALSNDGFRFDKLFLKTKYKYLNKPTKIKTYILLTMFQSID